LLIVYTYLAHPLACAAALEVQRIIKEERLLEQVRSLGQVLHQKLTERFGNHRHQSLHELVQRANRLGGALSDAASSSRVSVDSFPQTRPLVVA
jgi:adenosylmethionine-8-amino-7-oxononanoate aminotransferase